MAGLLGRLFGPSAAPAAEAAVPVAPGTPAAPGWTQVPPLAPVVSSALRDPAPARTQQFLRDLPSRWHQPPALTPLGHDVRPEVSGGLLGGVVHPIAPVRAERGDLRLFRRRPPRPPRPDAGGSGAAAGRRVPAAVPTVSTVSRVSTVPMVSTDEAAERLLPVSELDEVLEPVDTDRAALPAAPAGAGARRLVRADAPPAALPVGHSTTARFGTPPAPWPVAGRPTNGARRTAPTARRADDVPAAWRAAPGGPHPVTQPVTPPRTPPMAAAVRPLPPTFDDPSAPPAERSSAVPVPAAERAGSPEPDPSSDEASAVSAAPLAVRAPTDGEPAPPGPSVPGEAEPGPAAVPAAGPAASDRPNGQSADPVIRAVGRRRGRLGPPVRAAADAPATPILPSAEPLSERTAVRAAGVPTPGPTAPPAVPHDDRTSPPPAVVPVPEEQPAPDASPDRAPLPLHAIRENAGASSRDGVTHTRFVASPGNAAPVPTWTTAPLVHRRPLPAARRVLRPPLLEKPARTADTTRHDPLPPVTPHRPAGPIPGGGPRDSRDPRRDPVPGARPVPAAAAPLAPAQPERSAPLPRPAGTASAATSAAAATSPTGQTPHDRAAQHTQHAQSAPDDLGDPHDAAALDQLAGQLYGRLRSHLAADLLVGRERSQLLTDL